MLERIKRPSMNAWLLLAPLAVCLTSPRLACPMAQTTSSQSSAAHRTNAANPNDVMAAAQAALKRGDYAAALSDLKPLAQKYPGVAPVWFDLAYAHTGLHQNDEAVSAYQKAIHLDPKLFQARLNLGILLLMMNRPADAAPQLEQAVALKPHDAQAHLFLGRAEALTGANGAEKELAAASTLDPRSGEAWMALGHLRFDHGDYAGARDAFEKASAMNPQLAEAKLGAGISLQNLKQYALAAPYLEQYLAMKPGDSKVRLDLAKIDLYLGNNSAAMAGLKAVEKQNPSYPGLDAAFGAAYAKLKQFTESEKHYRLALAAMPAPAGQAALYLAMGNVMMQEKNYAEAESQFRVALKLNPSDQDAANGLAASLYFQKRYPEAISALLKVVQDAGAQPASYFMLAASYDRLHDLRPAIEAYQRFLSLRDKKNQDEEWQARQRIKLLEHQLQQ